MVESRTPNRNVGGGRECTALSPPLKPRRGALKQGTEPPTAPRVPTAPGVCSLCVCVCVHCYVCVLLDG